MLQAQAVNIRYALACCDDLFVYNTVTVLRQPNGECKILS